ncbi:MAG: Hsp20 family protein [Phycisphaera sp.]|nr:Hsp20 family protein [Phycisphaera sp.]
MLPTLRRSRSIFDNPLDVFQHEFDKAMNRWYGQENEMGDLVGSYPVDIREDEAHFYVDAELPGFTRDQVEVTLENGVLSITAQRKAEASDPKKSATHLNERRFTRVARAFTLPVAVDENKVDAKLDNGVLRLTLHKRDEVKPRKIEVK